MALLCSKWQLHGGVFVRNASVLETHMNTLYEPRIAQTIAKHHPGKTSLVYT